jgi:hypothetical protein
MIKTKLGGAVFPLFSLQPFNRSSNKNKKKIQPVEDKNNLFFESFF